MEIVSHAELRQHGVRVIARAISLITLMVLLYFNLPLHGFDSAATVLRLVGIVLILLMALGFQVRSIVHSSMPGFRAVEVIAVSLPMLILLPAAGYVLMSSASADSFSEPLTRIDALYFAVTVFSTVGFGDIAPSSQFARLFVSGQILFNLLLLVSESESCLERSILANNDVASRNQPTAAPVHRALSPLPATSRCMPGR